MSIDDLKRAAALAALEHVTRGSVLGVGTGSTVRFFIEGLGEVGVRGAVPSSEGTRRRLEDVGVPILGLEDVSGRVPLYVDGADEVDPHLRLLKGRGGALAREKVLATAAERFVCIADEHKAVPWLGQGPVALEVLPMAKTLVLREIAELGGESTERARFVTDNRNIVLDVTGLDITDPSMVEVELDAIPGVVECGIFSRRPADVLLLGTSEGVLTLEAGEWSP